VRARGQRASEGAKNPHLAVQTRAAGRSPCSIAEHGELLVLTRLLAELKGVLDNDPANNDLTVNEFFDKLTDVLVPEKPNAKVPFLMACLKGRLLKKLKENCELAGGIHEVDYDSCRDWVEQQLSDPDEVPRNAPQFHMPEVGATQEKLRGAKFLTTLDIKDGYWNAGPAGQK
jgi:hypothetical protein